MRSVARGEVGAAVTPMLQVENLEVAYGDVQVLWGVNLEIHRGELVALVGSNGAGKSTLLRAISGLVPPLRGRVLVDGDDATRATSMELVRRGIAHVPEGRRLFSGLTVRDNLLMGAYLREDQATIQRDLEWVYRLFPRLAERQRQLAGKMSGGEQQMCAIARGLMSRPRLLLIDELSLGLAPVVVDGLLDILRAIRAEGTTICLVEQDAQTALHLADRGYVMEHGRVSITGTGAELLANDLVRAAYLGL